MADEFHITRQHGTNIFIDVNKGIVTNVHNGGALDKKLNEMYVGKTITFMKDDFIPKMHHYHLRSTDEANARKNLHSSEVWRNGIVESISRHKRNSNVQFVGRNAVEQQAISDEQYEKELARLESIKAEAEAEMNVRAETLETIQAFVKLVHNFKQL